MKSPIEDTKISTESKIRIYDAGNFVGFLFESTWKCYRVLNRTTTSSGVEEELEEMPEDWVPYSIYSEEEYPLLNKTMRSGLLELQIPGWSLRLVPQVLEEGQQEEQQEEQQEQQEQPQSQLQP